MSDAKRIGLNCPVCECIFSKDKLSSHVMEHFNNPISGDAKKCAFPGCPVFINESQFNDHMLAHSLCEENGNALQKNNQLDDSLLASILQNEEDGAGPSSSEQADELLAQKIHLEERRKGEDVNYENLKEMYGMNDKKGSYIKRFETQINRKVGREVSIEDYFKMKSNIVTSMISGTDSGETKTSGVIEILVSSFVKTLNTTYFCVETDHFSVGIADKGWGCGYRNIQMLLSSMLKNDIYRKTLLLCGVDSVPSIPRLQLLIEQAWKNGYDAAGCEQLGSCLQGSKKWIGTTEVAALFSYLKIRTKIIDFHRPTNSDNTHPEMFKWIHNFFKCRQKVDGLAVPFPLYVQHQGHSRLCIGCEMRNDVENPITLFMFDPSCSKAKMKLFLVPSTSNNQEKSLKKSIKQMKQKQFQVLYIDGLIDESEIEASKIIKSSRIPP